MQLWVKAAAEVWSMLVDNRASNEGSRKFHNHREVLGLSWIKNLPPLSHLRHYPDTLLNGHESSWHLQPGGAFSLIVQLQTSWKFVSSSTIHYPLDLLLYWVTNARCVIRLVTVDVTKDSTTCLACVYLNEYKVATAAFTLHASENKLVRVSSNSNQSIMLCMKCTFCYSG